MVSLVGLFLLVASHRTIIPQISGMFIPKDIELLEGYTMDESSEYYPPDTFAEAESLRNFGYNKVIRNRRSPVTLNEILKFLEKKRDPSTHLAQSLERRKRSENEKSKVEKEEAVETKPPSLPSSSSSSDKSLPVAEKQIMDTDYYRKGSWNVQSFDTDYLKAQTDHDDPIHEATNNEGVKGRTPRVNFITQPRKSIEDFKERSILSKSLISPLTPSMNRFERIQAPYTPSYASYGDYYPSRSYDPYLRRYDRYDDQYTRYDPYYEDFYLYRRRYDPFDSYSPRTPGYPEPYYDYPDRRFDVPEPRDYRPVYSNDLYYDRPSASSSTPRERSSRRIIYYAHLPEIVRTPPSVDLTYNGRDNRYSNPSPGTAPAYNYPTAADSSANNKDSYGFIKREKKDFRNYPSYQKSSTSSIKQDP